MEIGTSFFITLHPALRERDVHQKSVFYKKNGEEEALSSERLSIICK